MYLIVFSHFVSSEQAHRRQEGRPGCRAAGHDTEDSTVLVVDKLRVVSSHVQNQTDSHKNVMFEFSFYKTREVSPIWTRRPDILKIDNL